MSDDLDYGVKVTFTGVFNSDNYDVGITFSDSLGDSLDKRYQGDIDSMDTDFSLALLEITAELMKQVKSNSNLLKNSKKELNKDVAEDISIDESKDSTLKEVSKRDFKDLEEENRRLNETIKKMISEKTKTSEPIPQATKEKDNNLYEKILTNTNPTISYATESCTDTTEQTYARTTDKNIQHKNLFDVNPHTTTIYFDSEVTDLLKLFGLL